MPKDKSTSHVHIVDAAMEEFMKKGFQGASIRTIADSAGITSGGLYRHFKDKEDMFHALVEPAVSLRLALAFAPGGIALGLGFRNDWSSVRTLTTGIVDTQTLLDTAHRTFGKF